MTQRVSASRRTVVKRIVLILAVAFTAWHIFATFLWIAPASGLRQAIPGTILRDYMIPLHGQSWSVFAPAPINGDYRLQVRAVVAGPEGERTTDWVDATAAELTMLEHNLTPPRAAIQSTELASRFKGAWEDLPADHKKIVELGYYEGADWEDRLEDKLKSYGSPDTVDSYLSIEHLVNAYGSQVAHAVWGDDVLQVQIIISRQNVIPFAERHDPEAERPGVQTAPTGWRGTVEEDGQSAENFAKTFRRALQESGQHG